MGNTTRGKPRGRGRNEDEVHAHRAHRHKQPPEHKVLALRDSKGDEKDASLLPDKSNGRPASFSTNEARLSVKEKRLSSLKEIVAEVNMSAKSLKLWRVCSSARSNGTRGQNRGSLAIERGRRKMLVLFVLIKMRATSYERTMEGSLKTDFFSLSLSLSFALS